MSRFIALVLIDNRVIQVRNRKGTPYFDNSQTALRKAERVADDYFSATRLHPQGTVQVYTVTSATDDTEIWTEAVGRTIR